MLLLPSVLKPFAGVGVADARREQAEGESQHGYIQHEVLLCAVIFGAKRRSPSLRDEVPPGA
jgi:hypothetical protein